MSLENHKGKVLLLLLGLTLVRGLIYSAIVPPWQAPDEPQHFEYVKLLYEKRRLVGWGDITPSVEQEIIASMDKFSYWRLGFTDASYVPDELPQSFSKIWGYGGAYHELHQPPLSYLLYAIPLSLTATQDTATQLYAMRLISILLSMLVVLVAFWTTKELFPEDLVLIVAVPAFIAFLPMHAFMTASVNNDHLAEAFVSLTILFLVRGFRRGFSAWTSGAIILAVVAGSLAKRTALVSVPICLVALPLYLWKRGARRVISWRKMIPGLAVTVGIVALVALGLWYWSQSTAEINRVGSWQNWLLRFYLFLPSEQFPFTFRQQYVAPQAFEIYRYYLQQIFQSFWGRFGWLNIYLDARWYQLLAIVSLAAFLGSGLFALRAMKGSVPLTSWQRRVLILFGLSVLFAITLIFVREIRNWDQNLPRGILGSPQGRYLFPVIIPVATLFVVGLRELVPPRYREMWLPLYIGSLVALDSFSLLRYIIPFFYG